MISARNIFLPSCRRCRNIRLMALLSLLVLTVLFFYGWAVPLGGDL